jgi:hypothetical protein
MLGTRFGNIFDVRELDSLPLQRHGFVGKLRFDINSTDLI